MNVLVRPLPQQGFAELVQDGMGSLSGVIIKEVYTATDPPPSSTDDIEHVKQEENADSANFSHDPSSVEPSVGDQISVVWPIDNKFHSDTVHSEPDGGRLSVHYDDGKIEIFDLKMEV